MHTREIVEASNTNSQNVEVLSRPGWKAYKTVVLGTIVFIPVFSILTKKLDTFKLYTKAQGTKTQNLIINMEDKDDVLIFRDDAQTLADCGCGKFPRYSIQ